MKRQAEREDGQLLIQTSKEAAAALSALPQGKSSESKDSKEIVEKQEKTEKNATQSQERVDKAASLRNRHAQLSEEIKQKQLEYRFMNDRKKQYQARQELNKLYDEIESVEQQLKETGEPMQVKRFNRPAKKERTQHAARKAYDEMRKKYKDDSEVMEILDDTEPQDIYEQIGIALGSSKLLFKSKGEGASRKRGIAEETGWKWNDVKGMFQLFDNEKGQSVSEWAETFWADLDEGAKNRYSDSDIKHMMLDVLGGASTIGDLCNIVLANRVHQAEELLEHREKEEEYWRDMERHEQELRETEEEAMLENIKDLAENFDEQEYYSKFADEILKAQRDDSTGSNRDLPQGERSGSGNDGRNGEAGERETAGNRDNKDNTSVERPTGKTGADSQEDGRASGELDAGRLSQERAGLSAKEREIVNRVNAGIDDAISDLDAEIRDLEKKGDEEGAEAARLEKEMLENSREDMIDDALDEFNYYEENKGNMTSYEKAAVESRERSLADRKAKRMRELLEKLRDPNTSDAKRRAVVRQLADLGVEVGDSVGVVSERVSVMQGQPLFRKGIISENTRVEKDNVRFNQELDAFKNNTHTGVLHLGEPSDALKLAGINSTEMFITPKTLKDHLKKHGLTVEDIRDLPRAMREPFMVYEWGTKAKSLICITELVKTDGRKITTAIKLERNRNRAMVNEIASIHGKEAERMLSELLDEHKQKVHGGVENALHYIKDKEKVLAWLGLDPPKGSAALTKQELEIAKIIKEFENPNDLVRENTINEIREAVEAVNGVTGGRAKVVREVDLGKDVPKNAQAWYDPNTGDVHVVAERVNGAEDAARAVWHEEIGHKAMSEDKINCFLGAECGAVFKKCVTL